MNIRMLYLLIGLSIGILSTLAVETYKWKYWNITVDRALDEARRGCRYNSERST